MIKVPYSSDKTVFFASDQHFGAPTVALSKERETKFVAWLDSIKSQSSALFLLGDLFDFWHEYDTVVPKGFVRVLGKIAEFVDAGIPVYFFIGNHDLWMKDYLEKEIGVQVFFKGQAFKIGDKDFYIAHGDGLGPGDKGYKRMKKVFTNPLAKWCFKWLHPDIGMRLGHYFSVKNKAISGDEDVTFLGNDKEWLVQYCLRKLETKHYDFFMFGHRHLPLDVALSPKSRYINTGDWIEYFSYVTFENQEISLKYWKVEDIIKHEINS